MSLTGLYHDILHFKMCFFNQCWKLCLALRIKPANRVEFLTPETWIEFSNEECSWHFDDSGFRISTKMQSDWSLFGRSVSTRIQAEIV